MTKNPFVNALAAELYIAAVASVMFYGLRLADKKETILIPIAVISLFTLSAAVMGYIFLYQPVQLYFEGEKKSAAGLFLKTTAAFACLTIFVFLFLIFF